MNKISYLPDRYDRISLNIYMINGWEKKLRFVRLVVCKRGAFDELNIQMKLRRPSPGIVLLIAEVNR